MTVEKISLSIRPDVLTQIDDREGGRSTVIGKSLDRYFAILSRARSRLSSMLGDGEIGLILDALNGSMFSDTISVILLWSEIEDSLEDGLSDKWNVNGPELVDTLKALTYPECMALVDAVECWWLRVSNGETPSAREALRMPIKSSRYPESED